MSRPVISMAQMREWEAATWASGQSEAEVIRRVGCAVARWALRLTHRGDSILILAGKGHNGDDARSAREHLSDRRVEVLEIKEAGAELLKLDASLSLGPALVVDGLFGTGLSRPLDQPWVNLIERVNAARRRVLAVDVPSGLDADTGEPQGAAVKAAVTLTVGAPKRGLLRPAAWPHVGRLEVAVDVGLMPCLHATELQWTLAEDFAGYPPPRPVAAHKGDSGHLAIIAGSLGYHGAAVLAARGAQRARPGLVSLFTQAAAYPAVAAQLQAVMVHPWNADLDLPGKFTAVLIGPGLAAGDIPGEMKQLAARWWKDLNIPVVVDASALDWLPLDAAAGNALRVITPHPGEAARLLKTTPARVQADRLQTVRELSRRLGHCQVALKGHQTLIGGHTGQVFVNPSGNPQLAQGGAGDVLAGYLGGLLAQPFSRLDALQAIRFAVWQHGAAADDLEASRPNWVVEDLAKKLGAAPSPARPPRRGDLGG
jgi:ADP-dependent NAD(P)H-hydrate dehydratase / NAD(P)H-hydrate epimerase